MITIKNKNALVVGGGRGIGAAIVEALAAKEANVWIFDADLVQDEVNHYKTKQIFGYRAACKLRDQLSRKGLKVHALNVDACSEEAVIQGFSLIKERADSISILVNAIGSTHVSNTVDTTLPEFTSIIQTNLIAPYITCREAAKMMLAANTGMSAMNTSNMRQCAVSPFLM